MPDKQNKPRIWVSIVLALIASPLAFLYLGKIRIAIAYVLAGLLIGVGVEYFVGNENMSVITKLAFVIISCVHAYLITLNCPENRIRPHYSRWYGLVGCAFVLFALVVSIRAFGVEPFHISSQSMSPTLPRGSTVLVQKWGYGNYVTYGLRLYRNSASAPLQRGDIIVFEYPNKREIYYTHRLIGLPGDRIEYWQKQLSINGKPVATRAIDEQNERHPDYEPSIYKTYEEHLDEATYHVLNLTDAPSMPSSVGTNFNHSERCQYDVTGFTCTVPPEHYFMMGDNRDDTMDSRYWGFLPADHIVGKVIQIRK